MNKKIKVAGYTKKINYSDGISYRPFSTLNKHMDENGLFSAGNFNVTTNTDKNTFKKYKGNQFSDYYTFDSLGVTDSDISLISNHLRKKMRLNLNPRILKNYAYFGSLKERVRVAIENIILKFPSALYIKPYQEHNGGIIQTNSFDFKEELDYIHININSTQVTNPYGIIYNEQETEITINNQDNPNLNFNENYLNYSLVLMGDGNQPILEFPIVKFYKGYQDIRISIDADGSTDFTTYQSSPILIRPNQKHLKIFRDGLDDMESSLFGYGTTPEHTYEFIVREMNDKGIMIESIRKGTWTTIDGYNLDFQNARFIKYVTELVELCDKVDSESSNLMIRQMVASSLLEYDTVSTDIAENKFDTSQKIKTILSLYGRNFDEVKNYIDGLSNATRITYDKADNAPDDVVRNIAKSMGWSMFDTDASNNLINNLVKQSDSETMTPEEVEVELWRRLVINTPYLFKSKGTRKPIEFLNSFLGIPKGMVKFNEYVYLAKNKLDYSMIEDVINQSTNSQTINDVPIDKNGFPRVLKNNPNVYYQSKGGWYSTTGGVKTDIDTNVGNNPHMGGYDSGSTFLNQFFDLVDDFKPTTHSVTNNTKSKSNKFVSYDKGRFDSMPLSTELSNVSEASAKVQIKTPSQQEFDECGCPETGNMQALTIQPLGGKEKFPCEYTRTEYRSEGWILFFNGVTQVSTNSECCSMIGGDYQFNYTQNTYICTYKTIVDCGRYKVINNGESQYIYFRDQKTMTETDKIPSAECCPKGTRSEPYEDGYRCSRKTNIEKSCMMINKYTANIQHPKDFFMFKYYDATNLDHYTRIFTTHRPSAELNQIVDKTKPMSLIVNLNNISNVENNYNYTDVVNSVGAEVTNPNDVIYTMEHGNNRDATLKLSFLDCPNIQEKRRCYVLKSLKIKEHAPLISFKTLRTYHDSLESDTVITEHTGMNDLTYEYNNIVSSLGFFTIFNFVSMQVHEISLIQAMPLNPINGNEYVYDFDYGGTTLELRFIYTNC